MTKVAIPVEKDCLSTHFSDCSHYVIYTVDSGEVINKELVLPKIKNIEDIPQWFYSVGVTDIVTYKINKSIVDMFIKMKMNVFVGTDQLAPSVLIEEYIKGNLKSDFNIIK